MDNENIFDEEDVILPDDFEGIPTSEEETEVPAEEVTENTNEVTEEVEEEGAEGKNADNDEQKLLDLLNSKSIKYNGEEVKVDNLDNLIATYQKGLNYDKLKDKTEKEDNEILDFVAGRAKKINITPKEYIAKVNAFEDEQKKALLESSVEKLVERGVDEETARRVANMEAYMETLKAKEEELNTRDKTRQEEEAKAKEYEAFVKAHADVDFDKLPAEIFENAKKSSLETAYTAYENKQLKEKLKALEQNQKNASSSVVVPTSDGSNTDQQSKDAFLMGFDMV